MSSLGTHAYLEIGVITKLNFTPLDIFMREIPMLRSISAKLGAISRSEAVQRARALGMIASTRGQTLPPAITGLGATAQATTRMGDGNERR